MTRNEIIDIAVKAGMHIDVLTLGRNVELLEAFAKLITQHEREACAKVVEASPSYDWHKFACEAAYAIRARGQA